MEEKTSIDIRYGHFKWQLRAKDGQTVPWLVVRDLADEWLLRWAIGLTLWIAGYQGFVALPATSATWIYVGLICGNDPGALWFSGGDGGGGEGAMPPPSGSYRGLDG